MLYIIIFLIIIIILTGGTLTPSLTEGEMPHVSSHLPHYEIPGICFQCHP